jgi:NAD(P)-dependent dehydrogenase (short-subunit alcohol dehydrogenase family)
MNSIKKTHLFILTGASRGMGLAMAQQLLQPAHTLLCISRNTNPSLTELVDTIDDATLAQWALDLNDGAAASARLATWLRLFLGDEFASATLINNAAIVPKVAPLSDVSASDIATVLRVGLEAPMQLTAAFLSATAHWSGARKVLNISSGNGRRAMASQATYSAAKAGMDHYSRVVALEEAAKANGAKICSLAPGIIDTDMQTQLRNADPNAFPDHKVFIEYKNSGQLLSPEAAAKRILGYLARPDFGNNPGADVRD